MQFLAVALNAGQSATAAAVRAHRWTIPVAYDEDGRVGEQYGVVACPMVELARRGGVVVDRLIGNRWDSPAALEPRVRALAAGAADERAGYVGEWEEGQTLMDKSHTSGSPARRDRAGGASRRPRRRGAVDPAVAAELPGLRLDWLAARSSRTRSACALALGVGRAAAGAV